MSGSETHALLALCAIHRADVAVAAFASQSHLDTAAQANSHATLCELVIALDRLELRHRLANHGRESDLGDAHEQGTDFE
jgi:ribose 1,5-bisphosphokinase PhnN